MPDDTEYQVKRAAKQLLEEAGVRADVYCDSPAVRITTADGEGSQEPPVYWLKLVARGIPYSTGKAYKFDDLEDVRKAIEFATAVFRNQHLQDGSSARGEINLFKQGKDYTLRYNGSPDSLYAASEELVNFSIKHTIESGKAEARPEGPIDLRDHLATVGAIFVRLGQEALPRAEFYSRFVDQYYTAQEYPIKMKFCAKQFGCRRGALLSLPKNFDGIIEPYDAAQAILDKIFFGGYEYARGNNPRLLGYPVSLKHQSEKNVEQTTQKLDTVAQQIGDISASLRRKEPRSRVYRPAGFVDED